jgi:hypothetical protein
LQPARALREPPAPRWHSERQMEPVPQKAPVRPAPVPQMAVRPAPV